MGEAARPICQQPAVVVGITFRIWRGLHDIIRLLAIIRASHGEDMLDQA